KRALLLVAVLAGDAAAHGRDPYVVRFSHRPGHEQDVLAGMTIGLIISHDGGTTWRWTCEEAIHYLDPFDPDYAFSAAGSVLARTFSGAELDRGGCSLEARMRGPGRVSGVTAPADGALYAAAADSTDSAIYKSTDEGTSWTPIANPGQPGDWWTSI